MAGFDNLQYYLDAFGGPRSKDTIAISRFLLDGGGPGSRLDYSGYTEDDTTVGHLAVYKASTGPSLSLRRDDMYALLTRHKADGSVMLYSRFMDVYGMFVVNAVLAFGGLDTRARMRRGWLMFGDLELSYNNGDGCCLLGQLTVMACAAHWRGVYNELLKLK
jgi:hypothetical protein